MLTQLAKWSETKVSYDLNNLAPGVYFCHFRDNVPNHLSPADACSGRKRGMEYEINRKISSYLNKNVQQTLLCNLFLCYNNGYEVQKPIKQHLIFDFAQEYC